jgi:hypothetical protein
VFSVLAAVGPLRVTTRMPAVTTAAVTSAAAAMTTLLRRHRDRGALGSPRGGGLGARVVDAGARDGAGGVARGALATCSMIVTVCRGSSGPASSSDLQVLAGDQPHGNVQPTVDRDVIDGHYVRIFKPRG